MSNENPQYGSLHLRGQWSGTLCVLYVFSLGDGCITKPVRGARPLLSEAPTLFVPAEVWLLRALACDYSTSSSLLPSQQFQALPRCSALYWVLNAHDLVWSGAQWWEELVVLGHYSQEHKGNWDSKCLQGTLGRLWDEVGSGLIVFCRFCSIGPVILLCIWWRELWMESERFLRSSISPKGRNSQVGGGWMDLWLRTWASGCPIQ